MKKSMPVNIAYVSTVEHSQYCSNTTIFYLLGQTVLVHNEITFRLNQEWPRILHIYAFV